MSPRAIPPGRLLGRLTAHGQLHPAAVLGGEVAITDVSRSNPVHLVWVDGIPRWFVKQAGPSIDGLDPLAAEHRAYNWLASVGLSRLAPDRFGVGADLLCLAAVDDAVPMHAVVGDSGSSSRAAVVALARLLARVHAAATAGSALRPRPWVLDLERGLPVAMAGLERTAERARQLVHESGVRSALSGAASCWTDVSVIHGDIKFDNVLVNGFGRESLRIWLIDWELSGRGDPRWDVAGIVDGLVVPELLRTGVVSDDVRRALAEVLRAYDLASGGLAPSLAPSLAPGLVAHLEPFVTARLVQTAVQLSAMAEHDGGDDIACGRILDRLGHVQEVVREVEPRQSVAA